MEPVTQPFNENDIKAQLAKTKFDQKWEVLKPVIRKMWIEEDRKLSELMKDIQACYGFTAEESQYKYHFKKWKWKRNISTEKKNALCKIRDTRAEAGKSTYFEHHGKIVDEKKLRRHMKNTIRKGLAMQPSAFEGMDWKAITWSAFVLGNSILLNWTRPFGTRAHSALDASSPMSISTPSDIVVGTPPANNAPSPSNAPSPFAQVEQKNKAINRAYMFVEGRHAELINSMGREQRETTSTWMYQFWVYAYKTAKHWGRGPRNWTADLLGFESYSAARMMQNPRSPVTDFETMVYQPSHSGMPRSPIQNLNKTRLTAKPSPLCHWSIHYSADVDHEDWKSRTPSPEPDCNSLNEATWKPWPSSDNGPSFHQTLTQGLGSNHFSDVEAENLPIALNEVVQALETTEDGLLEERLGFSIMARNFYMVTDILEKYKRKYGRGSAAYSEFIGRVRRMMPLHLAVTYLDGSKACCAVVDSLLESGHIKFRPSDTNSLGHTVFDCLMMNILKAHTYVTPGEVDDGLRDEKSFPGEEVDICGRFDADSDSVRALIAAGKSGIPFSWKHKLCHTSTQAICHCIQAFAKYSISTRDEMITDAPSGLFLKHCVCCGLRMQLRPLHTLVLIAFQLGQSGAKDEDLLGMIAILLCILHSDADPLGTADISMATLFPGEASDAAEMSECSHEPLRAGQMAKLASRGIEKWSNKAKVGWNISYHIFRIAERAWSERTISKLTDYELTDDELTDDELADCGHRHYPATSAFIKDAQLTAVHAAVQTELLTYRRLAEEDPWISRYFDMRSVLRSLETDQPLSIDLITKDMMQPYYKNGRFHSPDPWCPRAVHVMKFHFSNLEDWSRTTFLPPTMLERELINIKDNKKIFQRFLEEAQRTVDRSANNHMFF